MLISDRNINYNLNTQVLIYTHMRARTRAQNYHLSKKILNAKQERVSINFTNFVITTTTSSSE